jgi:TatD DNase family protein
MIDAHTHLHDHAFDNDRADVTARIFAQNITAIINIGTSIEESRDAVALATSDDRMYATVGIHPHIIDEQNVTPEDIAVLHKIVESSDRVVAIGEIGLDYHSHTDTPITGEQKECQWEIFVAQIELAQSLQLPVVVHCRDAYEDCYKIILQYPDVQFDMHCYMAPLDITQKFLALSNVIFSFAGNVTYSKTRDDEMTRVVRTVPLERMMIETDAPYLTPIPHRGKRNDSSYLQYTAQYIAQLKNISLDELDHVTTQNAQQFFHLK